MQDNRKRKTSENAIKKSQNAKKIELFQKHTAMYAIYNRYSLLVALISMCNSGIVTYISFFIISKLGYDPIFSSIYSIISMSISIFLNYIFGIWLDKGFGGLSLLVVSVTFYMCGCLALVFQPGYPTVIFVGVLCFPVASAATSTTFALAFRDAARDQYDRSATSAGLRAANSIGWMIGPAATFGMHSALGSQAVFEMLLTLGVVWGVSVLVLAPRKVETGSSERDAAKVKEPDHKRNRALLTGMSIVALFSAGHSLCSSALPLYLTQELALPTYLPGLAFSVKVLAELVLVMQTPRLIRLIGQRASLYASGATALVAFAIFLVADSVPTVLLGSFVEGSYYGVFSATSLTYIQSLSNGKSGSTTAHYVNSLLLGSLFATPMVGVIAQWSSFGRAISFAAATIACGLVLLLASRSTRSRSSRVDAIG